MIAVSTKPYPEKTSAYARLDAAQLIEGMSTDTFLKHMIVMNVLVAFMLCSLFLVVWWMFSGSGAAWIHHCLTSAAADADAAEVRFQVAQAVGWRL